MPAPHKIMIRYTTGTASAFNSLTSTHPSVRSRAKRIIDICGALVGLTALLILLIPVSFLIFIDNPGPIFFRQTRVGLYGKPFKIWKFRSMVVNAEQMKHLVENQIRGPLFKNKQDPRTTKVGRWLRRTSLDEFPQFWNVLCGDMSLVGTRPPTPDEVQQYCPSHWQRLYVKPGLTGEWQVKGRSRIQDFDEVIQLDLAYQEKWSLLYDISLIVETIFTLLSKHNAF
ncbi:MAG: sugar transferase [Cyanophyceae cyanobacterium]